MVGDYPALRENRLYRVDPRYREQAASALRVARALIVERGYDRVDSPRGVSLFAAIWVHQPPSITIPDAMGVMEARRILERLSRCWLFEWDALPLSSRRSALELIDSALSVVAVKTSPPHRGGWRVSSQGGHT